MAKYKTMMKLLLSVGILSQACCSDVKCRNDSGMEVDWYILYKYPGSQQYLYMDETTNNWTLSRKTIDSASGSLGHTLKPLLDYYKRKTEGFGYMLYNDQPPKTYGNPSSSFGHSKGVVMLDRKTGVWISHSTPKFPTYRSEDFWPKNGNANAQTFMCVTYSYDNFKEIGVQLKYIHVYSYDYVLPTTFHKELQCVARRDCLPTTPPWFRLLELTSLGNQKFLSFAKYTRFYDDLYSGLIVTHLNQTLYAKSWGKMRQPLDSNCSDTQPHVYNVQSIKLPKMPPFSDTYDHSKWCVTTDPGWACIADMNREVSQMKRGGGAICTRKKSVWRAFRKIVKRYYGCPKETVSEK